MERLEGMMQRVLEEVEMLKRMKQGARRKTNGEMFKGDYRYRLNPPEDAVTYVDEARGDAANRERGESDEERMARIERSARNFEEERSKRTMMQDAIATETHIIRQNSKEVRDAQQPIPETSRPYIPTMTEEEFRQSKTPLTPLRIGEVESHRYTMDPGEHIESAHAIQRENNETPSDLSFAQGDEGMFATRRRTMHKKAESEQVQASTAGVQSDGTRKISIRNPVMLGQTAQAPVQSSGTRESGVLGDQLESGVLGEQLEKQWEEAQERAYSQHAESPTMPSPPPTKEVEPVQPVPEKKLKSPSPLPPMVERATPDSYLISPQRQRSQYYVVDQYGRRQYFIGESPKKQPDVAQAQRDATSDWLSGVQNAVTPKKKDKGKQKEIVDGMDETILVVSETAQEVPPQLSLFATTELLEQLNGSPSKKLKKKMFRKPITTPFGLKESPVQSPHWPPPGQELELPVEELQVETPKKKNRRSWVKAAFGLSGDKHASAPQEPATMRRVSQGEVFEVSYPGPSQEVRGRNGFNTYQAAPEVDVHEVLSTQTTQPQTAPLTYRDSMSDSVRENALYNMKLGEELAQGRHPASVLIQSDIQTTIEDQGQMTKNGGDVTAQKHVTENVESIVGPFARARGGRDFTPTPPIRKPLPAPHLIPDGLLPDSHNVYGPTEPLTPQKRLSGALASPSGSPQLEDIYDADAVRSAFNKTLQRKTTPPRAFSFIPNMTRGSPRKSSNLAEKRVATKPTTLKQQREQLANTEAGQVSPSKTESSYKTAHDTREDEDDDDYVRSDDGVRPPSVYSHDSVGGSV